MTDLALTGSVRTLTLLAVTILLTYAMVRYRHNVLQRPAFSLVIAAALLLAASQFLTVVHAPALAIETVQLLAACLYLGATWRFAAEFVDFGTDDPTPPKLDLSAEGAGFEDD